MHLSPAIKAKLGAGGRARSNSSASQALRRGSTASHASRLSGRRGSTASRVSNSGGSVVSNLRQHHSSGSSALGVDHSNSGDDGRSVGAGSQMTAGSSLSKAVGRFKKQRSTGSSERKGSGRELMVMQQKLDKLETENARLKRVDEELAIMRTKAEALESERDDLYVKISNLNSNHNRRLVSYQEEVRELTNQNQDMHFKVERINQVENGIIEFFLDVKDRSADPEKTDFRQEREELRKLNPLVVLDYARANLSNLMAFKESYENELRGELARKKDENEETIAKLRKENHAVSKTAVEAKQKAEVYLKQLQEMEYYKNEMMRESEQVIGDLQRDNQELINLLREKEQTLNSMHSETENRDSYIKHLQQRNQQIKTLQQQLENTRTFHTSEIQKLKVAHGVELDEMKRKLSRMSMSVHARDKLEERYNEAQDIIRQLKQNTFQQSVEAMEKRMEQAVRAEHRLREEVATLQEANKAQERQLHQLKTVNERLRANETQVNRMRKQLIKDRETTYKEMLRRAWEDSPSIQIYKDKLADREREIDSLKEKLHQYLSTEQKKTQLVRRYQLERKEYEGKIAALKGEGGPGAAAAAGAMRPMSARGPRIRVVHTNARHKRRKKPRRPRTAASTRSTASAPVAGESSSSMSGGGGGDQRERRVTIGRARSRSMADEDDDDVDEDEDGEMTMMGGSSGAGGERREGESSTSGSWSAPGMADSMSDSEGDSDEDDDEGFVSLNELDQVYQLEKENEQLTARMQQMNTMRSAAMGLVSSYSRLVDSTVSDKELRVPTDPIEVATKMVELNTLLSAPSFGLRQQFTYDRKRNRGKIEQSTKEFAQLVGSGGAAAASFDTDNSNTSGDGGQSSSGSNNNNNSNSSNTYNNKSKEEGKDSQSVPREKEQSSRESEEEDESHGNGKGLTTPSGTPKTRHMRALGAAAMVGIQGRARARKSLAESGLSEGGSVDLSEDSREVVRHEVATHSDTYQRFREESGGAKGGPPKSPRPGSSDGSRQQQQQAQKQQQVEEHMDTKMGHGASRFELAKQRHLESTVPIPRRNRVMNRGGTMSTLKVGTLQ